MTIELYIGWMPMTDEVDNTGYVGMFHQVAAHDCQRLMTQQECNWAIRHSHNKNMGGGVSLSDRAR